MDIATLLCVLRNLLAEFDALNYYELKRDWSMWNDGSNLDELKNLLVTIYNVLLDADAQYTYDQLSRLTQQYIEELSFAIYDADDLLDEFITIAQQKHLLQKDEFIRKVGIFFHLNNPVSVACSMSKAVKNIMNKLDGKDTRHSKFGIKGLRRDETCSYADTKIIGRDEDVEIIVGKLVTSDVSSSLTIVGMGGIGKTALVQLVFNHEMIKTEFSLRLWVCVSHHDQSNLDVEAILSQILKSAGQRTNECSMEELVKRLRELLLEKRFLIVLDDLWTVNRYELQKLLGHLVGGKVGSRIVVTTRSEETANIMGESSFTYKLLGLSEVYSWDLFRLMAFDMIDHVSPTVSYMEKLEIGKDIIKICADVPLAIRVIGSLLYKQDKSKWVLFQTSGLEILRRGETRIMPILKFSYHNLDYWLKSCFSYCSLYPKDFKISKETLIRLWIAQGYVVPLFKGQSVEDLGEEYFLVLLRRCFFHDVEKTASGAISSFKLHDLMHDVALEVSKKEICTASSFTRDMDKVVRHVSLLEMHKSIFFTNNAHIRTYLYVGTYEDGHYDEIGVTCRRLRTLGLNYLDTTLTDSIGKLIHLRHLTLAYQEVLPKSITKLHNLQTLDLSNCTKLKILPKDFSNLVNLRVVKLYEGNDLPFMPSGMGKLSNLYELTTFVVGIPAYLEDLKALNKLKGSIIIVIHFPVSKVRDGGYIRDKEHLDRIYFKCKDEKTNEGATDFKEELLGALQPHGNLKELTLDDYQGVRMPRWAIEDNLTSFLPNLVEFKLLNCCELQCLPSLGKLIHLKYLTLDGLRKLKYMETSSETISVDDMASGECLFFPSLERLHLGDMPKLKKWWGGSLDTMEGGNSITDRHQLHQSSLVFLQLSHLVISECHSLTSLPRCPNLEILKLSGFNDRLLIRSNPTSYIKLKEVRIDNMSWLNSSLPMESFESLTELVLEWDSKVERLGDFGQVFQACSWSLRTFKIIYCRNLRSVSGGLCYLTALETLSLHRLNIVKLADDEIEGDVKCDGMPWGALCRSLQYLDIRRCKELQTFPKWMRKFTSLKNLYVFEPSLELYKRCQQPSGDDWPNIQHIPILKLIRW